MAKNNLSSSWSTGSSSLYKIPDFKPFQTSTYQLGGSGGGGSSTPRYGGSSTPRYSSLSESFNKMGLGRIGGLGGRMGDLEKASMRLGEMAAIRKEREQAMEYAYQSALQAQRAREERERG